MFDADNKSVKKANLNMDDLEVANKKIKLDKQEDDVNNINEVNTSEIEGTVV